jgi:uncharacterized repeat protein (TIGR01451 family)/CSLREA domain-containing protein
MTPKPRLSHHLLQNRNLLVLLLLGCGVAIGLRAVHWPVRAAATTYTVNSTADTTDGLCDATNCTLREALTAANANAGADTIDFSVTGTITLTSVMPNIDDDVTISGPGANVLTVIRDASASAFRIFAVNGGKTVTISGLTISGGRTTGGAPTGQGAGIFNSGTLTIRNSNISNNIADHDGGGIRSVGGASLTVINSTFTGNTSFGGGAIHTDGACSVINSTINNNHSNVADLSNGGGITVNAGGTLTITNSTVSGNSARRHGGGIYLDDSSTVLTITNSTVTGNRADSDSGGIPGGLGGGIRAVGAETLNNTIVAGNFRGSGTTADDINDGTINTANNNLIGDSATSGGITHGTNGNIVGNSGVGTININTVLNTTLANNGGPTQTHALVPGSPALNAGSNALLPLDTFDLDGDGNTGETLPVDQRGAGFPRIANTTVDIGAFEGAALVVTKTADTNDGTCDADCSLREAIAAASPGDTVLFSSLFNTPQTITIGLFANNLDINKDLNILGPGANNLTVSGNNLAKVFTVSAGNTVRLDALTVSGGNGAGGIGFGFGGGIFNEGTLTITNSAVSGNSAADQGGGIYNAAGMLTITNSTVSGNSALTEVGGGIYNAGTLTITNSTVSGNSSAVAGGGGIFNGGVLTITNSTISGNTAGINGGGIFSHPNSISTITNCTVTGNRADSDGVSGGNGGGIAAFGGGILNNAIVAGNFRGTATTADDISVDTIINTANNNLIGDAGSSGGITHGSNGNIVGNSGTGTIDINTVLNTTLANNGGPTKTHALVCGSPAIDAGSNALAVDPANNNSALTTDQRGAGFARVRDGDGDTTAVVDIGAFEVQQPTSADLAISKTHTGNFTAGQAGAQYTITVTNLGPGPTSGVVQVVDTLPAGLTPIALSGAGWNCTLGTLTCTRSNSLAAASSYPDITLTVNVAANAPSSVTNSVEVTSCGDANAGNNTATDPTTITQLTPADLEIEKSDAPDPVALGGQITYEIEVENEGPGAATNVVVTDQLPAGTSFVSASSGCTYNSGNHTVTCVIGSLGKDRETKRRIVVQANVTGTLTNCVTVAADQPDPKPNNNTDCTNTRVVIGIASLTLSPNPVKGGNNVTGTVTLQAPAQGNVVVSLSSNNNSVAKPSVSSITINSGQTSKTFTVKTFKVSSTKTVKIKASANGTNKEASLTVTK